MKIYYDSESYKLYQGNMLDMLKVIEPNSIDSIVCDPPYELNFMGKGWDNAGVSFQASTWKKCYDALKPGGYLLAFGGTRTFHRIACAIEDAGFEIRDTIMWLYGSGFPKSMNIGLAVDKKTGVKSEVVGTQVVPDITGDAYGTMNEKQGGSYKNVVREIKRAKNEWAGWGTALKPAYEPIIVARKPFKGSLVDNVLEYGVGGINIDECRVPLNGDKWNTQKNGASSRAFQSEEKTTAGGICEANDNGRFPANVIHDGSEEVCENMPNSNGAGGSMPKAKVTGYGNQIGKGTYSYQGGERIKFDSGSGSVSRYFYCAKASKRDRDEGLDELNTTEGHTKGNGLDRVCEFCGAPQLKPELCHCEVKSWVAKPRKNSHPTVKPTSLMQYLVRLVTPKSGTVLDPFMGSGSTGKAVMYENKDRDAGYKFIGIELTEEYLPIAEARIKYAKESE